MTQFMTKMEFCKHVKLSESTMRKFMHEGIPHNKSSDAKQGRIVFDVEKAISWIEDNKGVGY